VSDPSLSDWLALREPFDHAARSEPLTQAIGESLPRGRSIAVVDLGTGTGSNIRYLAPRLEREQRWLLVDGDPDVLAHLPARMPTARDSFSYKMQLHQLGTLDPALVADRDLVTASALLDLVSEQWISALAEQCRSVGAIVLFALTYTGGSTCSPAEPEDEHVRELFNRHQRANDKGFGRAAGPDAVEYAARSFKAAGYRVRREPSHWDVPADARELQRYLVQGWAEAAREIVRGDSAMIDDWLARRRAHIDAGRSRIVVSHEDLAAWPPPLTGQRAEG